MIWMRSKLVSVEDDTFVLILELPGCSGFVPSVVDGLMSVET